MYYVSESTLSILKGIPSWYVNYVAYNKLNKGL